MWLTRYYPKGGPSFKRTLLLYTIILLYTAVQKDQKLTHYELIFRLRAFMRKESLGVTFFFRMYVCPQILGKSIDELLA